MAVVVFYTSAHGLGHISRDIEVIHALDSQAPDTQITIRTSAPDWFIQASLRTPADVQRAEVDPGIVQADSLTVDVEATAREAARFYGDFSRRVAEETRILSALGASVVVGDVPPLAFAAARKAGIPSILLANFTWDWIYEAYSNFDQIAPGVIEIVSSAYATADTTLRLPLAGGFASVENVRDIAFIARRSELGREAARSRLNIPVTRVVALASFGRYGLGLPYEHVVRESDLTLVASTDGVRQSATTRATSHDNQLIRLSADDLLRRGLRYEDLVAAADVVITKPGYGIVSECAVNGTALLYAQRGSFVEQDLLIREMPRLVRCRSIAHEQLMSGNWRKDIDALLAQPVPSTDVDASGADAAAEAILAAG